VLVISTLLSWAMNPFGQQKPLNAQVTRMPIGNIMTTFFHIKMVKIMEHSARIT